MTDKPTIQDRIDELWTNSPLSVWAVISQIGQEFNLDRHTATQQLIEYLEAPHV